MRKEEIMLNRKKHLDIYLIILTVLTAATVVMRSLAALNDLDYKLGHYSGILISVADWITFAGSVLLLSYVALAPRGTKYRADFSGAGTYVPTALVCASLTFLAISLLTDIAAATRGMPLGLTALRNPEIFMPLLSALLALCAIYYFFLNSYIKHTTSERRARASFISILFLCVYPTYLYFSTSLPINAPNKVTDQMAYLFSAIFFLYEARLSLGRDRWGAYGAFGLIAALLTAYSSIPSLLVYFIRGEIISNSIAEGALTLSLFIFITLRLLTVRSLYKDEPSEITVGIVARHNARRTEMAEGELIFSEGEQIQFDMTLTEPAEVEEDKQEEAFSESEEPSDLRKTEEVPSAYESAEELTDIATEEEGCESPLEDK